MVLNIIIPFRRRVGCPREFIIPFRRRVGCPREFIQVSIVNDRSLQRMGNKIKLRS